MGVADSTAILALERQIKASLGYTPSGRKTNNRMKILTNADKRHGKKELSHVESVKCESVKVKRFLKSLKKTPTESSRTMPGCVHMKGSKSAYHRDSCTSVLTI